MAKSEGISYEQIISDLQNKKYKPVYFLAGDEPYYIDKISDFIEENVLAASERDFNLTVMYGLETNIDNIINTAKRFPIMSEYQVVIVKEAQNIKDKRSKKTDDSDDGEEEEALSSEGWDKLAYYTQKPLESTILVICYKYKTPDKRKKWVKDIANIGVYYESPKLRDYEIIEWQKVKAYLTSRYSAICKIKIINLFIFWRATNLIISTKSLISSKRTCLPRLNAILTLR